MLLLLLGMIFSALALVLFPAYFIRGARHTFLMRLAGASIILASLICVFRTTL